MTYVITNKNNCGGKLFKEHTWSSYSYDSKCKICGTEKTVEEADQNLAPLGAALVALLIIWIIF